MSLQYSLGTYVNTTFTPTLRSDMVFNITTQLSNAGWSGTAGSGDVTMTSAAGNQGQQVQFRIFDPGSGNCAQCQIKHPSGSPASQIVWLFPSGTWRIVATKFHFFAFLSGATNRASPRGFISAGVLYVPSFIGISAGNTSAWFYGNGTSDTDATTHCSWRMSLMPYEGTVTSGRFSGLWISTLMEASSMSSQLGGASILPWQGGYRQNGNLLSGYRWEDGTQLAYEPLLCWGTAGSINSESRIKGQFYDSVLVSGSWASEATISLDGHSWIALTDAVGSTGSVEAADYATLFLAVS
jgi:hypothetical protein